MPGKRKTYPINQCRLYGVSSPANLASRFGISEEALTALQCSKDNYNRFDHKQGDKKRAVQEPKPRLQHVHKKVAKWLSRVETPDYLHSAIKGRSYVTNAQTHSVAGSKVKIDIRQFFPSVKLMALYHFFVDELRCAPDAAMVLAKLLTVDGHLATGSSASPILSFWAHKRLFDELERLANGRGLYMTLYIDDLTFSGARSSPGFLYQVADMIKRHGLHPHKAKYFREGRPAVITGVCMTRWGAKLPNRRHQLIHEGFGRLKKAETPSEQRNAIKTLIGRVGEAAQVDPEIWGPRVRNLVGLRRKLDGAVPTESYHSKSE